MAKAWYTSADIIDAIKRKIAFPISQQTFTDTNILAFVNEEMMIEQVPAILQFHAEYFVTTQDITLEDNKSRYPVPKRAIGSKLRDLFYKDMSGNLFEMVQINSEDKAFFQPSNSSGSNVRKFYMQGNDIVLTPSVLTGVSGSLSCFYFLRPNQLVTIDQAAIIESFTKTITVDNASIVVGDTVTINDEIFTAVAGAPSTNEFQIGATSISTATNLVSAITTNGIVSASNGSPATAVITLSHSSPVLDVTSSDSIALAVSSGQSVLFDNIPSTMVAGVKIDLLQTQPGHQTLNMDVVIPSGSISGTTITFPDNTIPSNTEVGDYICLAGECIIPQIPTDLHTSLADRAAMRILEAIGDRESASLMQGRLTQNEQRTATLVDTRVEGSVLKAVNRHSPIAYNKFGRRRRR